MMSEKLEAQINSAEGEWLNLWKNGPARLRWNKIPLQVGDIAPDFELRFNRSHSAFARFLEQQTSIAFILAALWVQLRD